MVQILKTKFADCGSALLSDHKYLHNSGDELKLLKCVRWLHWLHCIQHYTLKYPQETRGYCPPLHTVMTVTRHTDPSLDCILMVSRGDVMTLMTGNGMNEKVERREVAGLVTGCRLAGTRCTALTLMVSTHHRSQHPVFTYPCIHLQHCGHTLCHCKYVQHCHCLSHHFSMIPPR